MKYTIEYNFIEHLNVKQDFLNTQICRKTYIQRREECPIEMFLFFVSDGVITFYGAFKPGPMHNGNLGGQHGPLPIWMIKLR